MLRLLKSRVLAGEQIEMKVFSQPPFSLWGGRVRMEQLFGKDGLAAIVDELNTLLAA
jgi:type I restriction enzyme R subunit